MQDQRDNSIAVRLPTLLIPLDFVFEIAIALCCVKIIEVIGFVYAEVLRRECPGCNLEFPHRALGPLLRV